MAISYGEKTDASQLRERTKRFALAIINVVESLPKSTTAQILGKQLLRCGTSVGANYRSACRAKSIADFIAKMGIVEEGADECGYWLDLLTASNLLAEEVRRPLASEANEIVAITVASIRTARNNQKRK